MFRRDANIRGDHVLRYPLQYIRLVFLQLLVPLFRGKCKQSIGLRGNHDQEHFRDLSSKPFKNREGLVQVLHVVVRQVDELTVLECINIAGGRGAGEEAVVLRQVFIFLTKTGTYFFPPDPVKHT